MTSGFPDIRTSRGLEIRTSRNLEVLISWSHVLLTFIVLCLKDQTLLFRWLCIPATDANHCHSDANYCHRVLTAEETPPLPLYSLPKP